MMVPSDNLSMGIVMIALQYDYYLDLSSVATP